MKHIVIVGGSFAGVSAAHRFLKQAAKTPTGPFKVTLVSRDTHFYWNIAAPRGMLPGQIPDDKLFQPIAAGFAHYPAGQFEFVRASATGIDVKAKQLEITGPEGKETKLAYDILVLGTGTHTKGDAPFKSLGSTEATKDALHQFQARVKEAKTIVVAGGGPTGIETAGELAFEYGGKKEVILITTGAELLQARPAHVSATALKQLRALNVEVRFNTKLTSRAQLASSREELTLSNGDKLMTDMYIPTYGVQPNSSYIPAQFLDVNGYVKVDEYLSVPGAEGVFAIGDISSTDPPQFIFVEWQSTHMAKNLILILSGKSPLPYKIWTKGMIGVQIGKKSGTGHFGNIKMPSFIVVMLRKSLFIDNLPRTVDGSML